VLCGRDHGYMPIVVEAKSDADFEAWLTSKKPVQVASAASATMTDAPVAATAPAAPAPAAPTPPPAVSQVAAATSVAGAKKSKDDLIKAGATVYGARCVACHQATGQGLPPTFPSLVGDKIVTGPAAGHISQILKGKNAMPPFAPMLSDDEIAAVATYERNSWGNSAGEVQADQVAALRGK
jgi:cytochrome c oxidase subunit 2